MTLIINRTSHLFLNLNSACGLTRILANGAMKSNLSAPFAKPIRRNLQLTPRKQHGEYEWQDPKSEAEVVYVNFINKDDTVTKVRGKIGDNILYLAKRFGVEVEGACEASLACTTCHVYIVDEKYWDKFPAASETEEDLLDAAPFLKDNSRLGCQLILAKEHDGLTLKLPQATRNFYVDGHKPTPH